MSKFTFFTILFSLIVIVIVGQLILRDAIFPSEFKADVVDVSENLMDGLDGLLDIPVLDEDPLDALLDDTPVFTPVNDPFVDETTALLDELSSGGTPPVSEPSIDVAASDLLLGEISPSGSEGFLTTNRVEQVGFSNPVTLEFSGKIFDLFDFGKTNPASVRAVQLVENEGPVGVITEVIFPDEISSQEFYQLLKNKTKVYVDLAINETNTYGERSFYINHAKKDQEAFLVVRIRKYIYTLAYSKTYHPRIKSLLSLLYADILS